MLTVLFVNHVARVSGAERTLRDLLRYLPGDIRAVVACPQAGDGLAALLEQTGAQCVAIPQWRPHRWPPWRALIDLIALQQVVRELRKTVRTVRPDVVHANSLPAAIVAARAQLRVPLVWQARDLRAPRLAVRTAYDSAAVVTAISSSVADAVRALVGGSADGQGAAKLRVIYNGIDLAEVAQVQRVDIRQKLGLDRDVPLVGTVAQIVPWKRIDLFLHTARLVADETSAHFVILGADLFREHGRHVKALRRLESRLQLSGRVHWLGYRTDALAVISELDVYLHTADAEPLGRSLLEAMALERPCIAPAAAGPAEIICHGDSGLLYPPGAASAAARAVVGVLADRRLAERLARSAAERVREAFDARRMAEQYASLYRELASGRGGFL
ncbi:MAG: glycosyltransferase family 4 protein [Armatimonadetes bacterium]|nr:glycosyltransferase family 4 protein [Armatimonadota bacterium]